MFLVGFIFYFFLNLFDLSSEKFRKRHKENKIKKKKLPFESFDLNQYHFEIFMKNDNVNPTTIS